MSLVNKGIVTGQQTCLEQEHYAKYIAGRTALIAQGGGQCGIFTAGVLDAFLLSNFDPFDTFYGTSAGALNLCAFLCRQHGLAKSFVFDITTNEQFFHLFSYIRQKQSMNMDWALTQLCSYPYKLDLDLGKKNLRGREAYAAVTEVSHIRDHYLPLLTDDWFKTMLATCAIPGLYSGSVKLSGERFVDGGVTAAVPVQEAWRQGSRNIVVIRTEHLEHGSEEEDLQEQQKPNWIREPISLIQERWSETVEKWKIDWDSFWQDQIDKSRNKKREHKHLELLNGGRWLFGAGDVYRLSHLLGGKFDSGLADYLMVHYQTFALTQTFLNQPPEDCFILQIAPAAPLKSSPLLSKEEIFNMTIS